MVLVAARPAMNRVRDLPRHAVTVCCQNANCGKKPGERAVLGQFEIGSTGTYFKLCDRCHHWNVVVLDSLW